MDDANFLPSDLAECQQLLLAAYRQSLQLERRAAEADRRAAESQQQVAELNRVLDETAASHEQLQQEHAATLDELAWYKRWAFGRRRERFTEGEGQGHLFELDPPVTNDEQQSVENQEVATEVKSHRRRKKRKIEWDKLPQIRHRHETHQTHTGLLADQEPAHTEFCLLHQNHPLRHARLSCQDLRGHCHPEQQPASDISPKHSHARRLPASAHRTTRRHPYAGSQGWPVSFLQGSLGECLRMWKAAREGLGQMRC